MKRVSSERLSLSSPNTLSEHGQGTPSFLLADSLFIQARPRVAEGRASKPSAFSKVRRTQPAAATETFVQFLGPAIAVPDNHDAGKFAPPRSRSTKHDKKAASHRPGQAPAVSVVNLKPQPNVPPLIEAAMRGNQPAVRKLLLDPGTDIHAVNPGTGHSALHFAALGGHTAIASAFLESGVDVNLLSGQPPLTALMAAAGQGHDKTVRMLLGTTGIKVDMAGPDGNTALLVAAFNNKADVVQRLLQADAQVTLANARTGDTALMHAAFHGYDEIVRILLKAPHIAVDAINFLGDSALMCASLQGHVGIVEQLIESGADIKLANPVMGCTALSLAEGMRIKELQAS